MTPKFLERKAFYAGSFDPFTRGHMSIVRRAAELFDKVVIAIGVNESKTTVTDVELRLDQIRRVVEPMGDSVEVVAFKGLTVDAARQSGACCLLRGVRNVADFEYESNLAEINRTISGLDTVVLFTEASLRHVSSSAVRELSRYGHDVSSFLPD